MNTVFHAMWATAHAARCPVRRALQVALLLSIGGIGVGVRAPFRAPAAPAGLSDKGHLAGPADCFAAYTAYAQSGDLAALGAACPTWKWWVSMDGVHPDKVHAAGAAVVLGQEGGDNASGKAGGIPDAGVDLGGGFSSASVPGGNFTGAHVLSIPAVKIVNCCGPGNSSLAQWIAAGRSDDVCRLLHDSVAGGIAHVGAYAKLPQATAENDSMEDHFSQCYHQHPDVYYLHLHTTAGVRTNSSFWQGLAPFPYNACVCQPPEARAGAAWGGSCPRKQPSEAGYVPEAARSLCLNVAAIGDVPEAPARTVCDACLAGPALGSGAAGAGLASRLAVAAAATAAAAAGQWWQ